MKNVKLKAIAYIVLLVIIVSMVAACNGGGSGGGGTASNLSGTPESILTGILEDITADGVEMPMALPPSSVDPEVSQYAIGLSTTDFNRLVADASYSMAAIGTFAHQLIVIQANDSAAAVEVKNLVSSDGGYDAQKWICVWPDKVATVDSGAYVLIVAAHSDVVDAALASFESRAGSVGQVVLFWDFAVDGEGLEEGGGLEIALG